MLLASYNHSGMIRTVIIKVFLIGSLLTSCSKETLIPGLEGSLVGYVYTFDEFANRLRDRSGVQVTAHGLRQYTTLTDDAGRFEFTRLPTGTYELRFYKQGFGGLKYPGVVHLGGMPTTLGLSYTPSINSQAFFIYRIPETRIADLSVGNDTLTATFDFKADQPERMAIQVYLSGVSGFTSADASQTITCHMLPDNGKFKCKMNFSNLSFESGMKVWFKAAILNRKISVYDLGGRIVAGIDTYIDYTTYKTVYPNLGDESNQFSFVMP